MKEASAKGHLVYNSLYMKCPEKADPWRRMVDHWLPGLGGQTGWGVTGNV